MNSQPVSEAQGTGAFTSQVVADLGIRVCAYLIDCIPALFLGLFNLIPIVGAVICGLLVTPYWLLRDITGASLGKLVLGLKVVNKDGGDSSPGQRILRNLTFAIGPALLIIPLLGIMLAAIIGGIIGLVEIICLLTQRERLGDRFAKTAVAKK